MRTLPKRFGLSLLRRLRGAPTRAAILMYHRISEATVDPWELAVSPKHLAEHMDCLRRFARPMPLHDLVQSVMQGDVPRNAVAVTFDDGYADNLLAAEPVLDSYDIPVTVFLTSGILAGTRVYWWDALERLLEPGSLPQTLSMTLNGTERKWTLGNASRFDATDAERHRTWRGWEPAPTARHALYCDLWEDLLQRPHDVQQQVIEQLSDWAGVDLMDRPTHRTLTGDEMRQLQHKRLVQIGTHTVTHPALPLLSLSDQREEIRRSKNDLEAALGVDLTCFAYPYGRHTNETAAIVRESGFACACTTESAPVVPGVDPYLLPRWQVHDCDREGFMQQFLRAKISR